jgi:SpoVK/Ycf46/Vps4 family AAA+-type ATPase
MLLKGSPGTGKTMCAVNIAKTIGGKFISAGINALKKGHIGQSAEAVADLWKEARANKPAVIFVDECDDLFPKRGSADSDTMTTEITNPFLSEWTGKEAGIWLIGCTNRRDILDDAILSRISSEMEFLLPDEKHRAAILAQELISAGYQGSVPVNIGVMTQGMSGRDLQKLARKAALKPVADFPALVGQARGTDVDAVSKESIGQLLQEMDGIKSTRSHVFALAATNDPDGIDPGVLSRFTERLVEDSSAATAAHIFVRDDAGFQESDPCSRSTIAQG